MKTVSSKQVKRNVLREPITGKKRTGILMSEDGLSLTEVLAAAVIIVVAALGIYIGILVAESQLQRNYHDRVAALLASGECDRQYYNRVYRGQFDEFVSGRTVTIDYYEGTDKPPLEGLMTIDLTERSDIVFGRTMTYIVLEVRVEWDEPLAGRRVVVVREDIFR